MAPTSSLSKQLVLVVGSPRSGTTWLHNLLGAHELICGSDEMEVFDNYTGPLAIAWDLHAKLNEMVQHKIKNSMTAVMSEDEFYDYMRQLVVRAYAPYLERKPRAVAVVDKTPRYSLFVEHIRRLMPGVKFIHLVRDGRDVSMSMLDASKSWAEWWAPKDIESAASVWREYVLNSRKAGQFTGQFVEVRYEDLLTNGEKALQGLYEFIGVPADSGMVAGIVAEHQFEKMKQRSKELPQLWQPEGFYRKGKAGDWKMTMTPMQRYLFHVAAGDLLCDLGYAQPFWWAENFYQRVTLPLFSVFPKTGYSRRTKMIHAAKQLIGPSIWKRLRALRSSRPSA